MLADTDNGLVDIILAPVFFTTYAFIFLLSPLTFGFILIIIVPFGMSYNPLVYVFPDMSLDKSFPLVNFNESFIYEIPVKSSMYAFSRKRLLISTFICVNEFSTVTSVFVVFILPLSLLFMIFWFISSK